jgi:hypothetical protein
MRGQFNITLNGEKIGVLVSQSKHHRTYRKASGNIAKETANLRDELQEFLEANPDMIDAFLSGKSIKL